METVRSKRLKGRSIVQIDRCPRCGDEHKDLLMVELNKYIFAGEYFYNYWKHCPVTKEPILGWRSESGRVETV